MYVLVLKNSTFYMVDIRFNVLCKFKHAISLTPVAFENTWPASWRAFWLAHTWCAFVRPTPGLARLSQFNI